MANLTSANYWTKKHPHIAESILGDQPHNIEELFPILDRFLSKKERGRLAFELGCVPGQGLLKLSERYHFVPNGSDFCPELEVTKEVFQRLYPASKFYMHDVGHDPVTPEMGRYDFVMSGGLIEHFEDFDSVVAKHLQLLKPGGLLLINTPNLSPLRALFWRVFDKELLRAHNPEATRLRSVSESIKRCGGEVLELGYFGPPHIWVENTRSSFAKKLLKQVNRLLPRVPVEPISRPFVYWIARRTE
jgi:SAM-dependent methyltransferase